MRKLNIAMAAALGSMTIASIVTESVFASSHREAPNITRFPKVDATDFYMFNSYEYGRGEYVTIIANYIPLQDAYGGPNYFSMDQRALYEIHIDNDGDAKEDITFQFRFKNRLVNGKKGITLDIGPDVNGETKQVSIPLKYAGPISAGDNSNLGFIEEYRIKMIKGDRRSRRSDRESLKNMATDSKIFTKPMDYVGQKTFGDQTAYAEYASQYVYDVAIPNCGNGKVFVGQRQDSFAVNLGETFDLVNYAPIEDSFFPGGIAQDTANNDLNDKNITTIAMEIPKSCLVGDGNGVIGGWTSAALRQARILNPRATFNRPEIVGGPWVQVSRLGQPLVNELVIGLDAKDRFNSSEPKKDGQFADFVTHPTLPALLDILFRDAVGASSNIAPNNLPRLDLVATFLTGFEGVNQLATVTPSEMLRLNTGIPAVAADVQSNFGVAGGDLAGFPNGRRPGDDVVDVALRVVMGRLCHPLTIGGNSVDLKLCTPTDAPVGTVPFTDGAPISAMDFDMSFPYLNTPLAGSPN